MGHRLQRDDSGDPQRLRAVLEAASNGHRQAVDGIMRKNRYPYRYQWYQRIYDQFPAIRAAARREGKLLGLGRARGKTGLYAGSSSMPGWLPKFVLDEIVRANQIEILPLRRVED